MDNIFATTIPTMHQLAHSTPEIAATADLIQLVAQDPPTAPQNRPWVSANMVMSADGAYTSQGVSGGLSSPGDKALFMALRAMADVVLVGASTVRAERYHRPSPLAEAQQIRAAAGQAPAPTLAIVSRSLDMGTDVPLLNEDGPTPIIVHPEGTDLPEALADFDEILAGAAGGGVDLAVLLAKLSERGVGGVLCEGGPHLLGQLASQDLIDEFNLTLAPQLVGGDNTGLLGGVVGAVQFRLHRILRDGDHLLISYRR